MGPINGKNDTDIHVMSTYFIYSLENKKDLSKLCPDDHMKHIFGEKIVIIPVHQPGHWTLLVLLNAGKLLYHSESVEISAILFFDSLGNDNVNAEVKRKGYATLVRDWLNLYAKDLYGISPYNQDSLPIYEPSVPRQRNGIDCGLFTCLYAREMVKLSSYRFSCTDLEDNFKCINFNFSQTDATKLRGEIILFIRRMSERFATS